MADKSRQAGKFSGAKGKNEAKIPFLQVIDAKEYMV